MRNLILTGFVAVVMCFAAGCGKKGSAMNHPFTQQAVKEAAAGNYSEAYALYCKALRIYPDSAELHWVLGNLCDESLNRPAAAIYHYEEFVRLCGEQDNRKTQAEEYAKSSLKRLVADAGGDPVELQRLKVENQKLKEYINTMRRAFALQKQQFEKAAAKRGKKIARRR